MSWFVTYTFCNNKISIAEACVDFQISCNSPFSHGTLSPDFLLSPKIAQYLFLPAALAHPERNWNRKSTYSHTTYTLLLNLCLQSQMNTIFEAVIWVGQLCMLLHETQQHSWKHDSCELHMWSVCFSFFATFTIPSSDLATHWIYEPYCRHVNTIHTWCYLPLLCYSFIYH
jgi:hypothetical protein